MARFVISLVAMAIAAVVFMVTDGWASWMAPALIIAIGFRIAHVVFRRLAEHETIRSDLEERLRNQHL